MDEQNNLQDAPQVGVHRHFGAPTLVIIFIILLLGGVGIYFGKGYVTKRGQKPVPPATQVSAGKGVTRYLDGSLPKALPQNIVQELNVVVVASYESQDPKTMQHQDTYKYESKNSLDKNVALYKAFLKNDGWTDGGVTASGTTSVIKAKKKMFNLTITVVNDPVKKINTVDITQKFVLFVPAR